MKLEFLHKSSENNRLILIFPGWSCGAELFRNISFPGWNVAVALEYNNLEPELTPIRNYSTIYLFAWSLGVFVAAHTLPENIITAAYAINGTLHPVDDNLGIPQDIYLGTADNLSPRNLMKFRRRMAGDASTFKQLFNNEFDDLQTSLLKKQLLDFYELQKSEMHFAMLPWKRAYISLNDAIFPPENMKKAWKLANVESVELDAPHYISLDSIISSVIPNIEKLSDRFNKAKETYNRQAVAQRNMAQRLTTLVADKNPTQGGAALEIGPGTGLFSREYTPILKPKSIDFVDISSIDNIGASQNENYFVADAEQWIAHCDSKYDYILSSSTFQWFANLKKFLANSARNLNKNGLLAFSTFLPGNLAELDEFRPSPICYPDEDTINEWLEPYFKDIKFSSEQISILFDSPRELLMHLKHTGVAGSAPSPGLSISNIKHIKQLTYRCAYFTCNKI